MAKLLCLSLPSLALMLRCNTKMSKHLWLRASVRNLPLLAERPMVTAQDRIQLAHLR
jgi:hypothetical protein